MRVVRAPNLPLTHPPRERSATSATANDSTPSSNKGVLHNLKGLFRGRSNWSRKSCAVAPAANEQKITAPPTMTGAATESIVAIEDFLASKLSEPSLRATEADCCPARISSSINRDIYGNGSPKEVGDGNGSPKEVGDTSAIHRLDSRCARVEDSLLLLLAEVRDIRLNLKQHNSITVHREAAVGEGCPSPSPGNSHSATTKSTAGTVGTDKAVSLALTTKTRNKSIEKTLKVPRAERLASRAERIEATVEAAARAVAEVSALENSYTGVSTQSADNAAEPSDDSVTNNIKSSSDFSTPKRRARSSSVRRSSSKEFTGERLLPKEVPKLDAVSSAHPLVLEPLNLRSKFPALLLASPPPSEVGPTPTRASKDLSALRELLHSRDGRARSDSANGGGDISLPLEAANREITALLDAC